jgi:hypothetical protein
MIRRTAARLLGLIVALSFAVPAGAATGLTTAQASGVCYWSGTVSNYVSRHPWYATTFTSYVQYKIGYDCNLNPYDVNVIYFSDTMTISNADSGSWHSTTAASICTYTDVYHDCIGHDWGTNSSRGCYGSCTVSRATGLNLVFPYNGQNFLWEHFTGCDVHGGSWCETWHFFTTGGEYIYSSFYS